MTVDIRTFGGNACSGERKAKGLVKVKTIVRQSTFYYDTLFKDLIIFTKKRIKLLRSSSAVAVK